jgi:hypothetical protein
MLRTSNGTVGSANAFVIWQTKAAGDCLFS